VEPGRNRFIVVGTTTGRHPFPPPATSSSTSSVAERGLHGRLRACLGSIYSLSIGSQYVASGIVQDRPLHRRGESLAHHDYTTAAPAILLADAAGAAVLRATEGVSGIIDTDLYSDGRYGDLLIPARGSSRHPATHETVDKGHALLQDEGATRSSRSPCACSATARSASSPATASTAAIWRSRPPPGQSPHHRGRGGSGSSSHGARIVNVDRYGNHGEGGLRLRGPRGKRGRTAVPRRGPRAHGGLRRRLHVGRGAHALVGS